jgi:hypothetical protein
MLTNQAGALKESTTLSHARIMTLHLCRIELWQ